MLRHHRELFEFIRKAPHMMVWSGSGTYDGTVNYILGYDHACEGGLLEAFPEWLELCHGRGTDAPWRERVLELAFPGAAVVRDALSESLEAERHAIETLIDLIAEFDKVRADRDSLREIYLAYERREKRA